MNTIKSSFFFFFMIMAVSVFGVNSDKINAEALNHLETNSKNLTDKQAKKLVKVQNKIKAKAQAKEFDLRGKVSLALTIIGLAVTIIAATTSIPAIISVLGVITLIVGVIFQVLTLLEL